MKENDISFILNHLGEERSNYFNSVAPPVIQSSNFCFETVDEMRAGLKKEFEAPFYTRGFNPTVGILRKKIAALENSEDALVFGSGSAAIAAGVISTVAKGDHVICVNKPYSWTTKLLNNILSKFGVETTMVNGEKLSNFEEAIKENTRLIFLESPNSWTFELQDIEAVCNLAKKKNITTIIDNSYSSPLFQQPISMGADMVVHSATKYLSGHSDVVAGVLCGTRERINKIFASELMTFGGILSPHDAWLMLKGMRTLQLRMERSASSGKKIVEFLQNHPKVEKVYYPFSKENLQYELARKQMCDCGGMFSVLLKTEKMEQVELFCNNAKRFLLACSWGGYESLIFPACTLYNSQNYDGSSNYLPWNLVRIYIGLEDPEVLIEDLEKAMALV